jgi:hypothetical protein
MLPEDHQSPERLEAGGRNQTKASGRARCPGLPANLRRQAADRGHAGRRVGARIRKLTCEEAAKTSYSCS